MNDFARDVVRRVMQDCAGPAVTPAGPGPAAQDPVSASGMPKRPNYQREKARQRLKICDLPPEPAPAPAEPPQAPAVSGRDGVRERMFARPAAAPAPFPAEAGFAAPAAAAPAVYAPAASAARPQAAELETEVLAHADRRVLRLLDISAREGDAVGLAGCPHGRVGLLAAADRVAAARPGLGGEIRYVGDGGKFRFTLSGAAEEVRRALAEFSALAAGECARGAVWVCAEPSPLLMRRLRLRSHCPVAGVDGVSFLRAAAGIQAYYDRHPDSMAEFSALDGAVLAQGEESEIRGALEAFRRAAGEREADR